MFDFEKLTVYQKALQFHKTVVDFLGKAVYVKPGYQDQLKRASASIVANIAEGAGRFTPGEKRRFYSISRGSAYECVAHLALIFSLWKIDPAIHHNMRNQIDEIIKMLSRMIINRL